MKVELIHDRTITYAIRIMELNLLPVVMHE